MVKIFLRNAKNKKVQVDLVRYFKYENNHYLIYTLNEKDEKDFLKLYVVKVMEELGTPILKYIENEWEWNHMPQIIQEMLKEIKSNAPYSFVDLDPKKIEGLKVKKARNFKLLARLTYLLSGDIKEEPIQESQQKQEKIPDPISEEIVKEKQEEIAIREENNVVEPILNLQSIYDITPVVEINQEDMIKEEPQIKDEMNIDDIEIVEPIEPIPEIDVSIPDVEISQPESAEASFEDLHIEDLIQEKIEIEAIPEIVDIPQVPDKETIVLPDFSAFEQKNTQKSIEDITISSENKMLKLENERVKKENENLKKELKEYQTKCQKLKDYIQREI